MTTIEPRLIALLNNDALSDLYTSYSTSSPSLELPPLHDPNILKASGRPLLLEPDASKRDGKLHHATLSSTVDEEEPNVKEGKKRHTGISDRALGSSSPQSLRKILDNDIENTLATTSKKRNIAESSKDEFVQLPQPPKKQKAAKQVVPPIIIGLFEPPPQAALFPPIASSSFHDSHGRNSLNIVPPKLKELRDNSNVEDSATGASKVQKADTKVKNRKDVKARKKWTEHETNNLLLGVHKHGVGRWVDILEDANFSFNERSSVDLKDRFRTCCPDELRRKPAKNRNPSKGPKSTTKAKSSLMSENILIEENDSGAKEVSSDSTSVDELRKSRAHRKNLEDLAQLGIDEPFRKSQRRERKPFTEHDDQEILLGYQIYGPAWTRIQRDTRFHLQNRQATDLRDRFRNKYPEKFRSDDVPPKSSRKADSKENEQTGGSAASSLQASSSRDTLKIHQILAENEDNMSKTSTLQAQLSTGILKDIGSYSDPAETTDTLPNFDWTGNAPFSESIGEMDISRLLLDEQWVDNGRSKEKQTFTDINSILTSTADGLPQVNSYYGMLVADEQINIPTSVTLDQDTPSS